MSDEIRDLMRKLVSEIKEANISYYLRDIPQMPDRLYDKKLAQLKKLEQDYPQYVEPGSPTKTVGASVQGSSFEVVKHNHPMLSLDNCFTAEELVLDFFKPIQKMMAEKEIESLFLNLEFKYDGLAVNLLYDGETGELIRATTRGDGSEGEDITENIRYVHNVPSKLKEAPGTTLGVRGEVIMPIKSFKALNERNEAAGERIYVNPRNAASGRLRNSQVAKTAAANLCFIPYGVVEGPDQMMRASNLDQYVQLSHLGIEFDRSWLFYTSAQYRKEDPLMWAERYGHITDDSELIPDPIRAVNTAECKKMTQETDLYEMAQWVVDFVSDVDRAGLSYEIDGVVVKLTQPIHREFMGASSRAPKGAIAYKFPADVATTTLLGVDFQVGRTGAITPVARLKKVFVGGVNVTNATLHNADEIQRLDVRVGCEVLLVRSGEVIPKIVGVVPDPGHVDLPILSMVEACPCCNTPLVKADGAIYYCPNTDGCSAQAIERFVHFGSRPAMNIDDFGAATAELLLSTGKVSGLGDLYKLTVEDLTAIGMGPVESQNLIAAINKSRLTTLHRLLFALGIPKVGHSTARDLASHYGTLTAFLNTNETELMSLPDIGPITASSIMVRIQDSVWLSQIECMLEHGLKLAEPTTTASPFTGQTWVVTGSVGDLTRDQVQEALASIGVKPGSSVSKKTHCLVIGSNPGKKKVDDAAKLNIHTITGEEFLKILKGN